MAKIISIIAQANNDSLMFTLDLAQVIKALDFNVCIVQDTPYQQLLFNYQFSLLEMSGVSFYEQMSQVKDEQIVLYFGYTPSADHYLIALNHDIFTIKSLSAYIQTLAIDTAQFVLLNALDVKQDIDYVYNIYFERFVTCDHKLAIAIDEREQERYFACQLAQQMTLKTLSRQRLASYYHILINIIDGEIQTLRQLKKAIKRG